MKNLFYLSLIIASTFILSGCGDPQKDFDEAKLALKTLNITEAYKKFKIAAEGGHPEAQFIMGQAYADASLLGPNDEESFKWFEKAADNEYPPALYQLAYLYEKGKGVKKDKKKSLEYLKESADLGFDNAISSLKKAIARADDDTKEDTELVKWAISKSKKVSDYDSSLRKVAKRGSKLALDWCASKSTAEDLAIVGEAYEKGIGYKENLAIAFKYYKKVLELDKDLGESAICDMANKYYEPAIEWVITNTKDANEILRIARIYLNGAEKIKKDEKKAFELMKKASTENAEAMFLLGGLYEKGQGCSADTKLYVDCLKKSFEKGYALSGYHLGYLYKDGKYVDKNTKEALTYLASILKSKINAQYRADAAFAIGEILMSPEKDAQPNFKEAEEYFRISNNIIRSVKASFCALEARYFSGERVSFLDFKSDDPFIIYRQAVELFFHDDKNKQKESIALFEKAAEKGLVLANYYAGIVYEEDTIAKKDKVKADKYFKFAFENKDKWHQKWSDEYRMFLAVSYEHGFGCTQDKSKAYEGYLYLAKKGNIFSQYKVAEFLRDGIGVEKNPKEALSWYYTIYKNARADKAAYKIGCMLISGELGGVDANQALDYFDKAKYDKEYGAMAKLERGKIYFYGKGVKQNYSKAMNEFTHAKTLPEGKLLHQISWENYSEYESYINDVRKESFPVYLKYADKFPIAKFRLARAYKYGYGTSKDLKKASELFAEMPEDNNACYELAMLYFNGQGVEQDDKKAFELFNKAKATSLRAEYRYVVCLFNGIGCEKNEEDATTAFKTLMPKLQSAANYSTDYQEVHYAEALYMLAQFYRNGWGVNKDLDIVKQCIKKSGYNYNGFYYEEALDWELKGDLDGAISVYKNAAEKGFPMAFVRLAAAVGNDANSRNQLLDKAIELGCRDAYLIKAGKMQLAPFGNQGSSTTSQSNNGNTQQEGTSLQKVNNTLRNISTGLKLFNQLLR